MEEVKRYKRSIKYSCEALILLLLLVVLYFILRCFGSNVTINNDSILVTNMLFSKKEISYSEID